MSDWPMQSAAARSADSYDANDERTANGAGIAPRREFDGAEQLHNVSFDVNRRCSGHHSASGRKGELLDGRPGRPFLEA